MDIDHKTKPARIRRAIVVISISLLVALGLWVASQRVDTGPACGVGLNDMPAPPTVPTAAFRIGTFNIAGGKGPDGTVDLQPTVEVLKGLDFVALQEVRGQLVPSEGNQAESLARQLGLGWLYAPAETRWGCKQFGNAVLSRLTVRSWQRIPLPREFDRSYRNVVFLVVDTGGTRPIHVLATHVTQRDPRDREVQLRAVFELFLAMEKPAILLGDLNSPPDSKVIRELLARSGVDDPVGRLAQQVPEGRVDWLLVRGLQAMAAGVRNDGISDHPLYWIEVKQPDTEYLEPLSSKQPAVQNEVQ